MIIYFDENKKPYGFEIENPICSIDDGTWAKHSDKDGKTWDIVDGVFTVIQDPDSYKTNQDTKAQIQAQIDVFDAKSIRALREGGIKDETTGQTWLEYYTLQIQELRNEINNLG